MPKGTPQDTLNVGDVLAHIHSLGVADRDEIGTGIADLLETQGLIEQVWVGNYALTKAGEQAIHKAGSPGHSAG